MNDNPLNSGKEIITITSSVKAKVCGVEMIGHYRELVQD
jgi:hypothetical protein